MTVKVRRERPDQRRHHRVTAPLYVEVGGVAMRAADWSLGGLRVEGFTGRMPATGSEISLNLTLPFQGFDVTFKVEAEVVRTNPAAGMFAVRYTEIRERERELMQHFIEELIRGSMVDVEDTIQRIDVPVTPASLQPDLPRAADRLVPVRRWPAKTVVMSAIYLGLGALIFSYAGIIAYSTMFRMEVETAVITAPIETIVARADGVVDATGLVPGREVRAQEEIARLIDGEIEREIEFAEIAVQEKKAKLAFMKRRQLEELELVKNYASLEMKNIQQTRVEMESLAAQLTIAENNEARLAQLHAKGFTTDAKLDEARRERLKLRNGLEIRRIELTSRVELASNNSGKRLYSGDATVGNGNIIGQSAQIEAEVRLIEHEIQLAQQRYIAQLNQREQTALRAPIDGTVVDVRKKGKANVRRGDVIALIEDRRQREVTAFLRQDEVVRLGLGDEVLLFIPALGENLTGRIRSIDRTTGFLREQEAQGGVGYEWRGSKDRSAKVTVAFDDPVRVSDFERYRSGLPVVAVFEQRSTNPLLSGLGQALGL